jgi:hypothetical protein
VPAERSLLDVIRERIPNVASSSAEGYRGTCETTVLARIPEHRDQVLTDGERAENKSMMLYVGRSRSPRLLFDL